MEALSSRVSFAQPVPFSKQVCSFPSSKLVRISKRVRIAVPRSFSAGGDEVVATYSQKEKGKQLTVIKMLRTSMGKSISKWWPPVFNLPSDTSSSHAPADRKSFGGLSVLPLSETAGYARVTPTEYGPSDAEPTATVMQPSLTRNERKQRRTVKFTAEKAKVLRQEMRASETWHDFMYHSAIASRLAMSDK